LKPPSAPLDLLVVAAHPDDAEISVGGTIIQSVRQGLQVGILDLTSGEPTPHGSAEVRARETEAATAILGVHWRHNLGLPNRSLQEDLDSRRALAGVFRVARPAMILSPYWEDAHPDHIAASRLCDAARFWAKLSRTDFAGAPYWPPRIYYYWSIHLRIHPEASFVVDVSSTLEDKLRAVACYESQFGHATERPTPLDDIRDRARYWGWSIHAAYGEPLASREQIGVTGLRDLR
jgi:bacillithiol biosynthesis deacetylase BshB1